MSKEKWETEFYEQVGLYTLAVATRDDSKIRGLALELQDFIRQEISKAREEGKKQYWEAGISEGLARALELVPEREVGAFDEEASGFMQCHKETVEAIQKELNSKEKS